MFFEYILAIYYILVYSPKFVWKLYLLAVIPEINHSGILKVEQLRISLPFLQMKTLSPFRPFNPSSFSFNYSLKFRLLPSNSSGLSFLNLLSILKFAFCVTNLGLYS